MSVSICCEGPDCNAGRSALVRETEEHGDLRGIAETMRSALADDARRAVSRVLAVTPHVRCGTERRAGIAFALFSCERCGHERVYGNSVTFQ